MRLTLGALLTHLHLSEKFHHLSFLIAVVPKLEVLLSLSRRLGSRGLHSKEIKESRYFKMLTVRFWQVVRQLAEQKREGY